MEADLDEMIENPNEGATRLKRKEKFASCTI